MLVPFAEWRPDAAALNGQYAADISNVLCADGGYIPFPGLVALSEALGAAPLNGFTARVGDNEIYLFVGTAEKLWLLNNTSYDWTDVTKTGATYGATTEERWCFAQYGNYIVATNINDNPQVFELGSSTAFDDLGGSPPKARICSTCGDFLILGGLVTNLSAIHWSALNDITGWTPGTDNSDYQEFPDGGTVMGVIPMTNPIIVQRSAIRFGTFVPGSVEVFTFQKVHDKRGAISPQSVCSRGNMVFYADSGGFFQLGVDGSLASIGAEKVDRTIFEQLNWPDLSTLIGAVDPYYSRVYWAARLTGQGGTYYRLLVYDWALQRWTQANLPAGILMPISAASIGYTIDGLSSLFDAVDDVSPAFDSRAFAGGAPILGAFDGDNKLGFFAGASLEAVLTTQEMGDTAGGVTRVSEIMPVVDTNNSRVSIGSRFRRGDTVAWSAEAAPSSNTGIVRKNSRSRYHRFKVRLPQGDEWARAQGIDVKTAPAGLR